jgi:hypothetical protein
MVTDLHGQVAIINTAVRMLAKDVGWSVYDLGHVMFGQERYVGPDGYHWPRHANLRMFEMLIVEAHNDYLLRQKFQ